MPHKEGSKITNHFKIVSPLNKNINEKEYKMRSNFCNSDSKHEEIDVEIPIPEKDLIKELQFETYMDSYCNPLNFVLVLFGEIRHGFIGFSNSLRSDVLFKNQLLQLPTFASVADQVQITGSALPYDRTVI